MTHTQRRNERMDEIFESAKALKAQQTMRTNEAIALLKRQGYRVSKPRRKPVEPTSMPTLNAIGKPRSPLYDPNWVRATQLTPIARLYKPSSTPHATPSQLTMGV